MAAGAYWAMVQRLLIVAGAIHALSAVLCGWLGWPALTLLNVASVAVYAAAYRLIRKRRNVTGIALVCVEVLVHAAAGSLLIGWEGGFHYYVLTFIPAIVIGGAHRRSMLLVSALLVFYLGLDAACHVLGPFDPQPLERVRIIKWINIVFAFGVFYAGAAVYRGMVLRAERRLLTQATTDPLTGLANRSHFHTRAIAELARARRSRTPVGLVLGDIDLFKRINDEFGHEAGDKVLVEVAAVLQAGMRDIDLLARWGGEEFLALLPASDLAATTAVAERIRRAVESMVVDIDIDGEPVRVTMSFGVSEMHGTDAIEPAIARADRSLYAAKNGGRNRVGRAIDA